MTDGFEVLSLSAMAGERLERMLRRASVRILDPEVQAAARRALEEVRARGDRALLDYTRAWDRVALDAEELVVSSEEVGRAHETVGPALRETLKQAIARTARFNERLRPRDWMDRPEEGMAVGVRFTPIERVGVYVPSGKGRFPSTCITIVTPAVVAGVPEIAVLVPPTPDGSADPATLVACDLLGVRGIYRCNGVAGVAALAVGTESIGAVDAIVGPGNPSVAATQLEAQRLGVRVPVLLGPTEAVILADESADPSRLALDLINEAEHGGDSAAVLVTDSPAVAAAVADALAGWLERLPEQRRQFAEAALRGYGGIVTADSMDEAVVFVNRYAPEHLQIATRDPFEIVGRIRHAGEILLGQSTPFSAGNYALGIPAALPTGGTARTGSGVTVLSFLKATSVAALDPAGLLRVLPIIEGLGTYEGFPAHVLAASARQVQSHPMAAGDGGRET